MKVLVVDDDPRLLGIYRRYLRNSYLIVTASSVATALEELKNDPTIEAVVSDYDLGDGTGAQILAWIKSQCLSLPFVLATGNISVNLGVPTLIKPFNPGEIRKLLG